MIQCNRCHLQYIGETKQRLEDRFNEHRRTLDNANTKSKSTTVAEHFLSSPHHISKDMQLIPTEKIFSKRDAIRKAGVPNKTTPQKSCSADCFRAGCIKKISSGSWLGVDSNRVWLTGI